MGEIQSEYGQLLDPSSTEVFLNISPMIKLEVCNEYPDNLEQTEVKIEISNIIANSNDLISECKLFSDTIICRILVVVKKENQRVCSFEDSSFSNEDKNMVFVHINLKSIDGNPSSCLMLDRIEDFLFCYCERQPTSKECDVLNTNSNAWQLICKIMSYSEHFQLHLHLRCCKNITFKDFYDDKEFTDFLLYGENDDIEAVTVHRSVLAVSSPVLNSMLLGDWKEAKQGNVRLPFITKNTLQHFKEYIYMNKIPSVLIDCAKLICLANYFILKQQPDLEKDVAKIMANNFKEENVWEWVGFCVLNKNANLLLMLLQHTEETDGKFINQLVSHFKKGPYKSVFESKRMSRKYYDLNDDEDFVDFELRNGDDSVHGGVEMHRYVLSAFSPVFKKLFLNEWKDIAHGYVQLTDTSKQTLKHFKDYVYLQKVPDDSTECAKLISLAAYYKIPELERDVALKIADNLKPDNIWQWLEYCVEQKNDYLLVSIFRNIYEHNKIVSLKNYFRKL